MVHEHMAINSPILIILFVIITFYEAKLVILYLILIPVIFLTLDTPESRIPVMPSFYRSMG